jgi:peptidoglycan/LPS O-acetylase OafA/YrhL
MMVPSQLNLLAPAHNAQGHPGLHRDTSLETGASSSRIPSLDGLRAISILFVICCHLWANLTTHNHLTAPPLLDGMVIALGGLGVTIFFVISGFLITNLLLAELAQTGRIHLVRFYFRRTFRLLPPYYALIATVSIGYAAGFVKAANWHNILIHALTYTTNYNALYFWYLGHGWSLSVEEQFYLLWPAVLLIAGTRRGFYLAASMLLICPLVRAHYQQLPAVQAMPWNLHYRLEFVGDGLAAGCLLARLRGWLHTRRMYLRLLNSRWFAVIPAIVLLVNSCLTPLQEALLGNTVIITGIAICIDRVVTVRVGTVERLLNTRPIVFLGLMSYSIYLWQQPFLNPVTGSPIAHFPSNVLFAAIASLASYYLIERPSLKLRHVLETKLFRRTIFSEKPPVLASPTGY